MEKLELDLANNNEMKLELIEEMRNQLPKLKTNMVEEIEKNITKVITEMVKSQSGVTNELGREKLKEMKGKLNKIILDLPESVQVFLNDYTPEALLERDSELRKESSEYDSMYGSETKSLYGYTIQTELGEFVKEQIGLAAYLLEEFGYKVLNGFQQEYKDLFEKKYIRNEYVFIYKDSRELKTSFYEEYGGLFSKINRLIDDSLKINNLIEQKKASDLWDEI